MKIKNYITIVGIWIATVADIEKWIRICYKQERAIKVLLTTNKSDNDNIKNNNDDNDYNDNNNNNINVNQKSS